MKAWLRAGRIASLLQSSRKHPYSAKFKPSHGGRTQSECGEVPFFLEDDSERPPPPVLRQPVVCAHVLRPETPEEYERRKKEEAERAEKTIKDKKKSKKEEPKEEVPGSVKEVVLGNI